jgi:16S rRNA (adenine1518-N6/adenine1519-N6)-dimethyltransferase
MHFLYPKSEKEKRPTKIVLLVQKEVAEKVCSARRDHSVLSLQVQIFGKPEIAGIVKKDCFHPAPKVDSAILKITTYQNPLVDDVELFLRTIKFAFAQRRKILLNSLKNGFHLTKDEIDKILLQAKISPAIRPQELEIADWQRLINILKHSL